MLTKLAQGMMSLRSVSLGACRLMARVTGRSKAASLRMPTGTPTVLTVTRRALRPRPQSAVRAVSAGKTFLRLAMGSPMPMNTMLLSPPTPGSQLSCQACCTIWPVVRLPSRPPRPEAQNLQPTGQPTWLEMQAVRRGRPLAS